MENYEETKELEHEIEQLSGGLLEDDSPRPTLNQGARMIESLGGAGSRVNVIPGGQPGACRPVLVVALGFQEDAEPRILQAVEHVQVRCKGKTMVVVFWAAWWDPKAWVRHRDSFDGIKVILRMLGMPRMELIKP